MLKRNFVLKQLYEIGPTAWVRCSYLLGYDTPTKKLNTMTYNTPNILESLDIFFGFVASVNLNRSTIIVFETFVYLSSFFYAHRSSVLVHTCLTTSCIPCENNLRAAKISWTILGYYLHRLTIIIIETFFPLFFFPRSFRPRPFFTHVWQPLYSGS